MGNIVEELRLGLGKSDIVEIELHLSDSGITKNIDEDILCEPTAGGGCTYDMGDDTYCIQKGEDAALAEIGAVRENTLRDAAERFLDTEVELTGAEVKAVILAAIEPAPVVSVREATLIDATDYIRNRLERIASASWHGDGRDLKRSIQGIFVEYDEALRAIAEGEKT